MLILALLLVAIKFATIAVHKLCTCRSKTTLIDIDLCTLQCYI